jgi:hypothetical protein
MACSSAKTAPTVRLCRALIADMFVLAGNRNVRDFQRMRRSAPKNVLIRDIWRPNRGNNVLITVKLLPCPGVH